MWGRLPTCQRRGWTGRLATCPTNEKEIVTMQSLAQTLTWIVAGLILGQTAMLVAYARFLYRFRGPALVDDACPRAAVILCVRGLDPFLPACLKGLLQQDYPDYDVWIVVDSTRDAAWPVVNELVQQSGKDNIHVLPLTRRIDTSSRKIAGILQAMLHLEDWHEIVAILDSDTIPHATWLRQLAAPCRTRGWASRRETAGTCRPRRRPARWSAIFGMRPRWCRCIGTTLAGAGRWRSKARSCVSPICGSV